MINNITVVSLSSGIAGEPSLKFQLDIGLKRLEAMGLNVRFAPNALSGVQYLSEHPEKRAEDLLWAFSDPDTDMILTAIGGDDTYRLLPFLFDDDRLKNALTDKVFLGFSDTTVNHFMLHKLGLTTYYGQALIPDICELSGDILPYTKKYFCELVSNGRIAEIVPSDTWYEERAAYTPEQAGIPLAAHPDHGFELLQGDAVFSGKILGGCICTIHDMFNGERYADMPEMCRKYGLFPDSDDWKGRILLLESSEERPSPEKYRRALMYLKERGVFDAVSGIIAGKPIDEAFAEEYKKLLVETVSRPQLPIVFNINVGHANPRCIIPFGTDAEVDAEKQVIKFS